MDDVVELEDYIHSQSREPMLIPLNEPTPMFCEAVSSVLHRRLDERGAAVEKEVVDRYANMDTLCYDQHLLQHQHIICCQTGTLVFFTQYVFRLGIANKRSGLCWTGDHAAACSAVWSRQS